jgi:hypothetical protein
MTAKQGNASVVTLLLDAEADANQANNVRQDRHFKYFYVTDNMWSTCNLYDLIWVRSDI